LFSLQLQGPWKNPGAGASWYWKCWLRFVYYTKVAGYEKGVERKLWYKRPNAGFWWLTAIKDVVYDYKSQNSVLVFCLCYICFTIIPCEEATLNISNCGVCNIYRNVFVWISWMYVIINVLSFSMICYS